MKTLAIVITALLLAGCHATSGLGKDLQIISHHTQMAIEPVYAQGVSSIGESRCD